jgi:uncharacterized protein YjbI with pentapeptide repeats
MKGSCMNHQHIYELAKEHEIWFKDNSQGSRLELRKISLQGIDFSGFKLLDAIFEDVDLTGSNFNGTNLKYSRLHRVIFCEAQMNEAILSETDMNNVDFTNANLIGLQIDGINIASHLKFDGAVMNEAFFVKSLISDSTFKNTSLKSANFKRAHLDKCSLQSANLEGADFTRALLIDVDFRGCNVKNAVFEGTRMEPIHIYGVTGKPAILADY